MAQVDFVNYFSILFWFYILFIVYYLINYSIILPSIYSLLKVRFNIYVKYFIKLKLQFNYYIKNVINFIILKNIFYIIFFLLKKYIYIYFK